MLSNVKILTLATIYEGRLEFDTHAKTHWQSSPGRFPWHIICAFWLQEGETKQRSRIIKNRKVPKGMSELIELNCRIEKISRNVPRSVKGHRSRRTNKHLVRMR